MSGLGAAALAGGAPFASRASAQERANQLDIPRDEFVLEAGWVLGLENGDLKLIRDGSVLVRGDRIEEVKAGPIAGSFARVALPRHILMPGLISGHTHVATGTPTRGLIEGGRRPNRRRPQQLADELDDDALDAVTAYNLAELLRSGCTTQVEMSLSLRQAQSYVRVADKWSVRGYPGGMIPGNTRLDPIWSRSDDNVLLNSVPGTLEEIEENLAFARTVIAMGNDRLRPMMSPHATDTHTPETMSAIVAAARELGTGIHIHLSQSAQETERVKRLWGMTPTEWLESLGAFEGPFFGAHMVALDWDRDPQILNRHGAVYAHCPSAGGAGGWSQPLPEALAADMNVNIAIDTHSNDFVENLKLAVIKGQTRYQLTANEAAPKQMPTIWDAVRGATLVGANGLGRNDLGRIEAGAKADLTAIDVGGFLVGAAALPPEPLNHLLYASGLAVSHVMTDGLFQIFEGTLVADDEDQVIREGGAVMAKLWAQLEAENWF